MQYEHHVLTTHHRHDKANIPEAIQKKVISNDNKQCMREHHWNMQPPDSLDQTDLRSTG